MTISHFYPNNKFQEGYNVKETMLCAGETQADSCQGDSGGKFLAALLALHSTQVDRSVIILN